MGLCHPLAVLHNYISPISVLVLESTCCALDVLLGVLRVSSYLTPVRSLWGAHRWIDYVAKEAELQNSSLAEFVPEFWKSPALGATSLRLLRTTCLVSFRLLQSWFWSRVETVSDLHFNS